ncbi:hypothetical protein [Epilithonimonas sp.]|uniref:hypothetical protein n=1 Tax=Epilithonimonas sp. TaxID=2894511 RepID=UPI0028A29579|nr:hypothetical protein [Epilithonimonas sp.]
MREYKKDDFVRYVGNLPNGVNIDIAQIFEINYKTSELKLIISSKKIETTIDLIRPIYTTKENLINLGFAEERKKNFTLYKFGNLEISSVTIHLPQAHINIGFSLGNVSALTDEEIVRKYFNKDMEFDFEKFHSDFPDLNNINDFIDLYAKLNPNFNRNILFGDLF